MDKEVHKGFYGKYFAHAQTVCTGLYSGGRGLETRLKRLLNQTPHQISCHIVFLEVACGECFPFPQAFPRYSLSFNKTQHGKKWVVTITIHSTIKVSIMSQMYHRASTVTAPLLLYSSSICRNSYRHPCFMRASILVKQGQPTCGESLSCEKTNRPIALLLKVCSIHHLQFTKYYIRTSFNSVVQLLRCLFLATLRI